MTFTRGPWKCDTHPGCRSIKGGKAGTQRQAPYKEIATTVGLSNDDEDFANARLMAAAPRLLEFTKILIGYGCAGVGQDVEDSRLCGECASCEATKFLRTHGLAESGETR